MIKSLVERLPDETAALQLLELFDKLLKKYARMLGTEDAYEDLRLFLFELLNKLKQKNIGSENDGYLVSYISKSIKNHYIALSKLRSYRREDTFSDISDEQMIYIEQIAAMTDNNSISEFYPIAQSLSEREKKIIQLFFVHGYSVEEIANQMHISRQAINQAKLRALEKIRKAYFEE